MLLAACIPELPKQAPGAPTVSITPAAPGTGDDLRAVIGVEASEFDGDVVTYAYGWKQAGLPRTDLTTDTVPASETTKGEVWEVTVTASDVDGTGTPTTALVTILNTSPEVMVTLEPAAPVTGDDVVAVATATDADGDPVTFTYAWTLDGAPRGEEGDRIAADRTEHGQVWSVTVTPADDEEPGAPVTSDVTIANAPR